VCYVWEHSVGGGLDPAGELCGLGVICVAVAVGRTRGFLGQPVNPALPPRAAWIASNVSGRK